MDDLHEAVKRRFAEEVASGTVEIHRRTSEEAAAFVEDGSLDWV